MTMRPPPAMRSSVPAPSPLVRPDPVGPCGAQPPVARRVRGVHRPRMLTTCATVCALGLMLAACSKPAADRATPAAGNEAAAAGAPATPEGRPALSVSTVAPQQRSLPVSLAANGSVAAWQEAILGAEINGLRLTRVLVNVGDPVRRGQLLAEFAAESVNADIAQAEAALAEAQAARDDAQANARRAQQIADTGALSSQQVAQYQTTEKTAQARVASARAQLATQKLRLRYTRLVAPDDGVISARNATVGSVVALGQELFRLIRDNRVEWRAEVLADEVGRLKPGQEAEVQAPGGVTEIGKIRMIAPTVDPLTRNTLVYVDLPRKGADGSPTQLKPGMFARGEFRLGNTPALTIPQTALSLRDGFNYVFRVGELREDTARVTQLPLRLGRRLGDQVEVLEGLKGDEQIVATGAAFLTDGDRVRVVQP